MEFLTNDKLVIFGAAGMIGSNMAQTALMMGLTSNLCLYDVFPSRRRGRRNAPERFRQCEHHGYDQWLRLSKMPSISFLQVVLLVSRV